MKKILLVAISLLLTTSIFAQTLRIATFPFTGSVVTSTEEGEFLAGLFTSEFIPLGYTLVTRTTGLGVSAAERDYQTSGATAEIAEIGKQVAADYVLVGALSSVFGQMSLKVEVIGVESSQIVASETQRIDSLDDLTTVSEEMVKNLNSQIKGSNINVQMPNSSILQIANTPDSAQKSGTRYSIGVTALGLGTGILRGKDAEDFTDESYFKKENGLSMFPVVQVDFIINFSPYFALETGLGFGTSTVSYGEENNDGADREEVKYIFAKNGIIVPLMARGQAIFGIFSMYASIGPKFIISTSQYGTYEYSDNNGSGSGDAFDANGFLVDLGIAIGGEFKIANVHYLGLRLGYDINLVSPVDDSDFDTDIEWNHDIFGVSVTYRYAF